MTIVDAHQHFWDPARASYPWMTDEIAPLRRRFGPEELEPLLREHGVSGTVVVQARQELDETRDLLAIADATPFVWGVVGWVDLTGDVAAQLAAVDHPKLVGVRHLVHDEPDPAWLLREDVQRGLAAVREAGLVYDLLVRTRELPAAIETARRHPALRFVLDHVAKAPRGRAEHAAWEQRVAALADCPNVVCKVSGLFIEADPAGTTQRALHWFGSERCLWGSDWPVCTLASAYGDGLPLVGDDERVLGGTAIQTYGLVGASARSSPDALSSRQSEAGTHSA
jgi:L-fuconolactonase